jgi:uncharacterized protein YuzE
MRITYDPEGDALYIEFRRVQAHDSTDIEEGVTADLDENGHIIGLEILDASQRLTPEELTNIHYENLMLVDIPEDAQEEKPEPAKASKAS